MKKYTISLGEKIRFGFSDIGINLAFYMITSYFMLYLTDVVGLQSKIVGTIFLIAMLFDAINDPIIGGIADRTRTKIGTYRPWMIAAAVPYCMATHSSAPMEIKSSTKASSWSRDLSPLMNFGIDSATMVSMSL